jgi:beta-mannanase
MTAASQFEQLTGKHVSLINWSSPFYSSGSCNGYCAFQTGQFNAVRNHGSIPFFSWAPNPGTAGFSDAQVAAGSQDSYLRSWAQAAKTWGHPLFLRFAWEMNGSWFPWGVGNNGTTAADYVAMWRHVHDVFASVGADNVTWTWCPNIDPHGTRTPMSSLYPGDAYVDWTCLDGYNGDNPWTSFNGLFKSSYETITQTIAPSKPMVLGEMGSTEAGGSKAQWIADMLGELPSAFPKIRGLLWFNKFEAGPGGQSDWPIESSTSASDAFAAGVRSSDYVGNSFGSLDSGPIPSP